MEKYILMIDDDLDDFMVLNDIMAQYEGVRCHYACDAVTGIEMMEANMPHAVLLDMNMPAINGLECLKMIKANPAIAHVPVFIFSTSISETIKEATAGIGAQGCLQKPCSYKDYKTVVEEILRVAG